ncbi:spiro-SPASM protein [Leptospira langatensis]|uniref:Spiro-SPASM protein n=1 Tax=Leptospira langatensis TaxID=2484983 RepID=A0A5F1ZRH3_9LEPT|nr:spiro-SPASM protein [Leptospira langatensis]TGK02710.1 spiro-SPASM protein [Leptospira langatensis]TGL40087.1 spiro-SPASM protein [Leptospira langatensis]
MKFPPQAVVFYLKENQVSETGFLTHQEFLIYFANTLRKLSGVIKGIPVYSNLWLGSKEEGEKISREEGYTSLKILKASSEPDLFSKIAEELPASRTGDAEWDETSFLVFDGLAPLLDPSLTAELVRRHDKYLAQYSYSENLPPGIVPRILSREFVRSLPQNYEGGTQEFLAKNINHYDTEIFYSSPDLRQWRLDFSLSDLRSKRFVSSFLQEKQDWKYEEFQSFLVSHPEVFRSAPSYYEIELHRGCEYQCVFCPRQNLKPEEDNQSLDPEILDSILSQAEKEFGSSYSVCFGGLGEPTLHPKFAEILQRTISSPHLKELFIESALYGNLDGLKKGILSISEEDRKKISLVVNLTTRDKRNYAKLYGKDNLEEVLKNLEAISQILPKSSIYLQFLKIQEVDPELDSWYEETQKAGYEIILQKYNSYSGKLAQRRASDLTPLGRDFCWHIARDMYINANGEVSICKQTPASSPNSLGNLRSESLVAIWKKGNPLFSLSAEGKHGEIPAPCLSCDEWYTFNA